VVPAPTAQDMEREVLLAAREAELVVMAAAVADFRPKAPAEAKLKKEHGPPEVVLEPTPDILAELGRRRRHGQVLVGFAAETAGGSDLEAAARAKLVSKGVDLVVANDVSAPGVGFAHDTNAVVIVSAEDGALEVPLADKAVVAAAIVDAATRLWQHRKAAQGGAGARQENHP
jgi:phosphopantothenoylcysteine decarboxylase/phosphopantothenate--cysteine ligase